MSLYFYLFAFAINLWHQACETVMFQKSHKFNNTVLKKRCFERKFMQIYLIDILVSATSSF